MSNINIFYQSWLKPYVRIFQLQESGWKYSFVDKITI